MNQTLLLVAVFVAQEPAAPEATVPAYQTVNVTDGGAIAGTVKVKTPPASQKPAAVSKDPETCGHAQPDESVLLGPEGALANVVVRLEGVRAGKAPDAAPVEVDQLHCRFVPHVSAFMLGTKVAMKNSDGVLHNTHAYLGEETLFNIALPMKGMRLDKKIKKPGLVKYVCDAGHTWMRAFSYVHENPYVVVSDKNGQFRLTEVPPGKYELVYWHELLGEKSMKVSVGPKEELRLELGFD